LKNFRLACLDRQCSSTEQYLTANQDYEERKFDAERSRTARPICAQPVVVYAREREGKSQVIALSCRAALDMDCAVLVFVAPTKVSPVADTAAKVRTLWQLFWFNFFHFMQVLTLPFQFPIECLFFFVV